MADLIQVSKVRNFLKGNGFQIKAEALDTVDESIGRMLEGLIQGAVSEDIKSIGTDDVHRLFKPQSKKRVDVLVDNEEKHCSRCRGIQSRFIEYGRNLQAVVSDEAQMLLSRSGH